MGYLSLRLSTREHLESETSLQISVKVELLPLLVGVTQSQLVSNLDEQGKCLISQPVVELLSSYLRERSFLELLLLLTCKCSKIYGRINCILRVMFKLGSNGGAS